MTHKHKHQKLVEYRHRCEHRPAHIDVLTYSPAQEDEEREVKDAQTVLEWHLVLTGRQWPPPDHTGTHIEPPT